MLSTALRAGHESPTHPRRHASVVSLTRPTRFGCARPAAQPLRGHVRGSTDAPGSGSCEHRSPAAARPRAPDCGLWIIRPPDKRGLRVTPRPRPPRPRTAPDPGPRRMRIHGAPGLGRPGLRGCGRCGRLRYVRGLPRQARGDRAGRRVRGNCPPATALCSTVREPAPSRWSRAACPSTDRASAVRATNRSDPRECQCATEWLFKDSAGSVVTTPSSTRRQAP